MGKEERDKGQDVETQVLEKGYTHYLYAKQRRNSHCRSRQ